MIGETAHMDKSGSDDNGLDGDISNVNPTLLQMSSNAEDWKQQRKEALLKLFASRGAAATGDHAPSTNGAATYMPRDGHDEERQALRPAPGGLSAVKGGNEQYVLQQIASMKRRREGDGAQQAPPPPEAPAQAPAMTLKERLMQKFSNSGQN